jgi:hypothetical protein
VVSNIVYSNIRLSQTENFIRRQLFVQWPNARQILFNLARNIGNEIFFFGQPIFVSALMNGVNCFKENYSNLYTRDRDIFIYFFKGVISTGLNIFHYTVKCTNKSTVWDFSVSPFIDWRIKNPGQIALIWQPKEIDHYLRLSFLCEVLGKNTDILIVKELLKEIL